jgi:hypothetical protein
MSRKPSTEGKITVSEKLKPKSAIFIKKGRGQEAEGRREF